MQIIVVCCTMECSGLVVGRALSKLYGQVFAVRLRFVLRQYCLFVTVLHVHAWSLQKLKVHEGSLAWPDRIFSARRLSIIIISACTFSNRRSQDHPGVLREQGISFDQSRPGDIYHPDFYLGRPAYFDLFVRSTTQSAARENLSLTPFARIQRGVLKFQLKYSIPPVTILALTCCIQLTTTVSIPYKVSNYTSGKLVFMHHRVEAQLQGSRTFILLCIQLAINLFLENS